MRCVVFRSGLFQNLFHGTGVIPVSVRRQHGGDGYAEFFRECQQLRGIVGGVDQQRLVAVDKKITLIVHLGHG